MNTFLSRALISLTVILATVGQAFAGTNCSTPDEQLALETAALQQKLMVAALYCSDVRAYNNFVIAYLDDLKSNDKELLRFFSRINGADGENEYHAYKTDLANNFSKTASLDTGNYCANADGFFEKLEGAGRSLQDVAAQEISDMPPEYSICEQKK